MTQLRHQNRFPKYNQIKQTKIIKIYSLYVKLIEVIKKKGRNSTRNERSTYSLKITKLYLPKSMNFFMERGEGLNCE